MRSAFVVPSQPGSDPLPRFLKRLELMLPDALFFETPKESFDDAILLRRVRRDELLLQPIVPIGLPEPTTLKDQAVVTAQDRRPCRPQRAEALQTRGLDGPLG